MVYLHYFASWKTKFASLALENDASTLNIIYFSPISKLNKGMKMSQGIQYLVEEKFDIVHGEDGAAVVHVLLQVPFQVLEHQRQALVRVHDVVKGDCKRKAISPLLISSEDKRLPQLAIVWPEAYHHNKIINWKGPMQSRYQKEKIKCIDNLGFVLAQLTTLTAAE